MAKFMCQCLQPSGGRETGEKAKVRTPGVFSVMEEAGLHSTRGMVI